MTAEQSFLKFDPLAMTDAEHAVWNVLSGHQGVAQSVTQHQLAHRLGTTARHVRHTVKFLVEIHRKMICSDYSSEGGYFVPVTQQEIDLTYNRLRAHALSILKRASVFRYFDLKKIQRELPL